MCLVMGDKQHIFMHIPKNKKMKNFNLVLGI